MEEVVWTVSPLSASLTCVVHGMDQDTKVEWISSSSVDRFVRFLGVFLNQQLRKWFLPLDKL